MTQKEKINSLMILIYFVVFITVFQSGVDFQMSMFMYYPPKFICQTPNQTDFSVTTDNCYYYNKNNYSVKYSCHNWKFDSSQIQSTVVTEMLLICKRQYMQLILVPLRNLSSILALLFGLYSDIMGRKFIFLLCLYVDMAIWILIGFVPSSYELHATLRFCKISGTGASLVGYVILTELTPKKYRYFLIINYWSVFSVGLIASPAYFKIFPNWREAWLLSSWPMIFYFVAPFVLVESPKWLIVNNRRDEAIIVLKKLEQYSIEKDEDEKLKFIDKIDHWKETKEFCKSYLLMSRLAVLVLASLSFYLVYQGTSTNLEFAVSDIYLNAVIMGAIEIPAGIFGYFSNKYMGNVVSVVLWTIVGVLAFAIIPGNWNQSIAQTTIGRISHIVLATLAKFFMVVSWNVLGVSYLGLFPTNQRNFVTIFGETFGYIGAAIGGFIGYYYQNNSFKNGVMISNAIYGMVMVCSSILFALVIPQIKDIHLPNTIEEAKLIQKYSPTYFSAKNDELEK